MGIRFFCPNGHKLNVKEFQAGRKGICPYCAAKFVVPLESTRKSSKEMRAEKEAPQDAAAPEAQPEPTATPTVQPGQMPVVDEQMAVPTPPVEPQQPTEMGAADDPLAEGGSAVWYVRPPSGGQFGPANADIMREWITEGRVSSDSLVWREGWRDWQEASTVFPQFGASESRIFAAAPAGSGTFPPELATLATAGGTMNRDSSRAAVERERRPLSPRTMQAAIISGLLLAIIVLLAVFMTVLFGNPPEENTGGEHLPDAVVSACDVPQRA